MLFFSVVAFGSHILIFHKELTAAQAFTSLSLFGVLTFPLFTLPQVLNEWVNSAVALNRLQDVLLISLLFHQSNSLKFSVFNGA